MNRFRNLSLGVRRAILAGTIPGAMIAGSVVGSLNEYRFDGEDFFAYSIFAGIPIYWAIVFIGLWIYEGFKGNPGQ